MEDMEDEVSIPVEVEPLWRGESIKVKVFWRDLQLMIWGAD
jgi:hypothetical protein